MDWSWNWGGECFGYRDGESLFTYLGKEARPQPSGAASRIPLKRTKPSGQYPERGRHDSNAHGRVALLQALNRFHIDHHAPGHVAHRQVPALAGHGDVASELLQLVGGDGGQSPI
jgi:hypothetical protein